MGGKNKVERKERNVDRQKKMNERKEDSSKKEYKEEMEETIK
jgi:hypothetical protein